MPFVYDIAMGVRRGDLTLKAEIESVLARRHGEIRQVLDDFRVPLVP
jgi:mxaJ protein